MSTRRQFSRISAIAFSGVALAAITGCGMMKDMPMGMASSNMVALSTQMRAANEVPPNASQGTGSVDAKAL